MTASAASDRIRFGTARGRWVLLATVLGSGLAALDSTAVNIALPDIGRDLHTGFAGLQWVSTAYLLTLTGLLLLGGALGDRYGRRRIFLIGVVWFAGSSLLCSVAPDIGTLIAARALQGVGGALLTPGSLAIISASFHPDDRGRAVGAWAGLGGVATAIGPFLGGWLVQAVSWRLVFLINLPLAVAVLYAARHVPETRDAAATGRVDWPGGALAAVGLGGVTYGLVEGPGRGFAAPVVLVALVLGAALLAALIRQELRAREPMLPLSLFRSGVFDAANAVTFVVYAALGGALFLLPIELQTVAGFSPVEAGVSLLPMTLVILLLSARSGALAARLGPRPQMTVGPLLVAGGMLLFTRIGPGAGYLSDVLPAVVVMGLGLAATVTPLTSTVLAAAPVEHAGIASAVNNDVARAAGLLAVALLPAVAGLAGAGSPLAAGVFDRGFSRAVVVAAGLCVVGGGLAFVTLRPSQRRRRREPPPSCYHCAVDATPLGTAEGG